jgi:hypothetical protein
MRENRGIALGVALAVVGFLMVLPALLVVSFWLFLTVATFANGISASLGDRPALVLVGLVLLATALVTLTFAGVAIVGRPLLPRRRRTTDAA